MYHSSSNIYHESLIIQQLPCIISHLSPYDYDSDYDYDYD